jgi:tRNA A-37 threonylcarbamoyl transferase component Bud32
MEGTMRAQIADNLETILHANTEALRGWAATMESQVEFLAADERVQRVTGLLLERASQPGPAAAALLSAPEQLTLRALLEPASERYGFDGYVVLDTTVTVLAARREQLIGMHAPPGYAEQFRPCLEGKTTVTRPFPSVALLADAQGNIRAGVPTMFVAGPVRDAAGRIVAVLGLRIVPERDFTRILATARAGQTGETYAFDRNGLMLSESRFDDQLKRLGLIPDTAEAGSILTLQLRDPLVDLSAGQQPPRRRAELPFTQGVKGALAGHEGVDAEGYRDYRGVPVVGAWTWLPEFNMGLVTESDVAEAFAPLRAMRLGFWFLFGLLTLGSVFVFVLMRVAGRLQEKARRAALKAKQLGQYTLDEKIGAGAFGSVYLGHHALMRRPVAVKLLDPALADDGSIQRFEREVQLTCQLTHPNTIALYDYGRTPEGIFYYAMEYLDGLSLYGLVKRFGSQPEGRVIHILRQVCASLAEAHDIGLVHRDIKPHNIFLTRRGGMPDFVKVLDFGLVKARSLEGQAELTGASATLGTPLYMSPEAIEKPHEVDARSDIYSLGAVGYFLLTGETVFSAPTVGEVLMQQVHAEPQKPSSRLRKPVSSDLEDLLMQCLAKSPAARPAGASALEEALGPCQRADTWARAQAAAWWDEYADGSLERTMIASGPPSRDSASGGTD